MLLLLKFLPINGNLKFLFILALFFFTRVNFLKYYKDLLHLHCFEVEAKFVVSIQTG
jgi:hypothetical protein